MLTVAMMVGADMNDGGSHDTVHLDRKLAQQHHHPYDLVWGVLLHGRKTLKQMMTGWHGVEGSGWVALNENQGQALQYLWVL